MCGWSSAWWIWLNGKEKMFVRQANGKGFKLYQSMLHPDSRHIQQKLSVKIDFDTFRFSVSKTRISIERAQWKPQENPQWRRHKNQTFDESKISRWCVDYIFFSLSLSLSFTSHSVFSAFKQNSNHFDANIYRMVISCHNCHYTEQHVLPFLGPHNFLHMYQFMYHWTMIDAARRHSSDNPTDDFRHQSIDHSQCSEFSCSFSI